MGRFKLVAALRRLRFMSWSIAPRRRPVGPGWSGHDWLLEDRRLLTSPGPVPLAAPEATTLLHVLRSDGPELVERVHHDTTSKGPAHAAAGAGKQTLPSNGIQQNEGDESKEVEAPALGDSGGLEGGPRPGESGPPAADRPKYAIAGAAVEHVPTAARQSPLVSAGVGGVSATATPIQSAAASQAAAHVHPGIVQAGASSVETAPHDPFGTVHRDEWTKNSPPTEKPSGPRVTSAPEVRFSTAALDGPKASDGADRGSNSTEMPSLSGLDDATRAFVTAIYGETFDRLPEVVELKLWSRHLKAGVDPRVVAWRIWTSAEHRRLQRHGIVAPKAFQRTYEAAAAAVWQARTAQQLPPGGPMALTARGPSPTPAGASMTGESHPTSPRPIADRQSRFMS